MSARISVLGRVVVAAVCLSLVSTLSAASTDSFGTGTNQFDIDFVTISGATNPTSGYGIVNNDYRMGTYEVTNDQWNKFKAELAPVAVTGSPSSAYNSDPYYTGTNVPTNRVSWYEAAQFVNWLNTSTGHQAAYKFTGTQGTGGYTLDTWSTGEADGTNLYRHKDAFYYMPTEDEWVKAAYWNGTNLQTYATPDDTVPVAGTDTNYHWAISAQPWNVGSGSEELNGTYDMMGNVAEWMESPYSNTSYGTGSGRGLRGGSYNYLVDIGLASSTRADHNPRSEYGDGGFRVASEVPASDDPEVPEPATMLAGLAGLAGIGRYLRRRTLQNDPNE